MSGIKISVLGAGSSYTPELIDGFINKNESINIDTLYLMDIDEYKLNIMTDMVKRMLGISNIYTKVKKTTNLITAVEGSDFIINQIRVGGLEARISDEKLPLRYNLLGQETTGAGGFMNAMRTIPIVIDIAKTIQKHAPKGWLLNFTNPAGLVMEAVLNTVDINAIGLCNGPANMQNELKLLLGREDFEFNFVGLNHLCWVVDVFVEGKNIIEEIFDSDSVSSSKLKNLSQIKYESDLLKATRGLPIGYLNYYYFRQSEIDKVKNCDRTRGEVCQDIEKKLYELYADPKTNSKPCLLNERGGALYSTVAVSIIDSILNNKKEVHIVDVKNKGAYNFMDDNDVVEVKCIIGSDGVEPVKLEPFDNDYIIGMMKAVKAYERLTAKAALTGSYSSQLAALMVHPLIGEYHKAKAICDFCLRVK